MARLFFTFPDEVLCPSSSFFLNQRLLDQAGKVLHHQGGIQGLDSHLKPGIAEGAGRDQLAGSGSLRLPNPQGLYSAPVERFRCLAPPRSSKAEIIGGKARLGE